MSLTFKSSVPESRVMIQRGQGGERVCKAVAGDSGRTWDITLSHPDGMHWKANFHGNGTDVGLAMLQLMVDKENEQPPRPVRDRNVRVDDLGQDIAPPIRRFV